MFFSSPPGSSTRRFSTSGFFGGAKTRWYTSIGRKQTISSSFVRNIFTQNYLQLESQFSFLHTSLLIRSLVPPGELKNTSIYVPEDEKS